MSNYDNPFSEEFILPNASGDELSIELGEVAVFTPTGYHITDEDGECCGSIEYYEERQDPNTKEWLEPGLYLNADISVGDQDLLFDNMPFETVGQAIKYVAKVIATASKHVR